MPRTVIPTLTQPSYVISDEADPLSRYTEVVNNLRHEYDVEVSSYIRSLGNNPRTDDTNDELERRELHIIDLMTQLGFFVSIHSYLNDRMPLRTNSRYDYRNLTHRFILLYAFCQQASISGFSGLVEYRPLSVECSNIPTVAFTAGDLDFLRIELGDPMPLSVTESRNLQIGAESRNIDFIVNGQKLKLSLHTMNDPESRSRYVLVINVRVTSERSTTVRHIARFEKFSDGFAFKRLTLNRPVHGFKFVRSQGRDGLFVKEID
jgi:hypothetical protein